MSDLEYDIEYTPPIVELVRQGQQSFITEIKSYTDPDWENYNQSREVEVIPNYAFKADFDEFVDNNQYSFSGINKFISGILNLDAYPISSKESWNRRYIALNGNASFSTELYDFSKDWKVVSYLDIALPKKLSSENINRTITYWANNDIFTINPQGFYVNDKKIAHSLWLFEVQGASPKSGVNNYHWRMKISHDRKQNSSKYSFWKQVYKNYIWWEGVGDPYTPFLHIANTTWIMNQDVDPELAIGNNDNDNWLIVKTSSNYINAVHDFNIPYFLRGRGMADIYFKIEQPIDFQIGVFDTKCSASGNILRICKAWPWSKSLTFNYKTAGTKLYSSQNFTKQNEIDLSNSVGEYNLKIAFNKDAHEYVLSLYKKDADGVYKELMLNSGIVNIPYPVIKLAFLPKTANVKFAEIQSFNLYSDLANPNYWIGLKTYQSLLWRDIKNASDLEEFLNRKNHKVLKSYVYNVGEGTNVFSNKKFIHDTTPLYTFSDYTNKVFEYSTLLYTRNAKDIKLNITSTWFNNQLYFYVNGVYVWNAKSNSQDFLKVHLRDGVNKLTIYEVYNNGNWRNSFWTMTLIGNALGIVNGDSTYYAYFTESGNDYVEASPLFIYKEVWKPWDRAEYRNSFSYIKWNDQNAIWWLYGMRTFGIKRANFKNNDVAQEYYANLALKYQVDSVGNDLSKINGLNKNQLNDNGYLTLSGSVDWNWLAYNTELKETSSVATNWYNTITNWLGDLQEYNLITGYSKWNVFQLTNDLNNFYTILSKDKDKIKSDIILAKMVLWRNGDANTEFFLDNINYLSFVNKSVDIHDVEDRYLFNNKFWWSLPEYIYPFTFYLYNKKNIQTNNIVNNISLRNNVSDKLFKVELNTSLNSYNGYNWLRINKSLNTISTDEKWTQKDKYLYYYKHFKINVQ